MRFGARIAGLEANLLWKKLFTPLGWSGSEPLKLTFQRENYAKVG